MPIHHVRLLSPAVVAGYASLPVNIGGKLPISRASMNDLQDLCDVPPKARRSALLAAGGDVQKALLHLIDSGQDLVST